MEGDLDMPAVLGAATGPALGAFPAATVAVNWGGVVSGGGSPSSGLVRVSGMSVWPLPL